MVAAIMRKTVGVIRTIFTDIRDNFVPIKDMEKTILVNLSKKNSDKIYRVDLQKLLILINLEPSLLYRTSDVLIDGDELITIIKEGTFFEKYPKITTFPSIKKRIP